MTVATGDGRRTVWGFRRAGRPEHLERDADGTGGAAAVRGGFAPTRAGRLSGVTQEYTARLLREADEERRRRRPGTAPGPAPAGGAAARAPRRRAEGTP